MKSIIVILIAFTAGMLVALAGSQGSSMVGTVPLFLICAVIAYAVNWLAFVPAFAAKTEKFYDLTGSLTYLTVIATACYFAISLDTRAMIVAAMVAIWAIRLGSFLFRRISEDGGDHRFDKIKQSAPRFLLAWTLQATWVVMTAASAIMILTSDKRVELEIFAFAGIAIWIIGFAIEVIADKQKRDFRKQTNDDQKFIKSGLWAWSQHPNYFGEIMLWAGITVMSIPLLSGWQWVTIISPIFVWFLLTKVSGIPTLDKKAKERWADDTDYQRYRQNTSKLLPLPTKS